jgi:hypothetical protein
MEENILPKVKKRKLINTKELAKVAKKVRESFKEEAEYMLKKKLEDGDNLQSSTHSLY